MKRVLQVVDSMDMGGIQTFIMNVYRHIDRDNLQFDFMVFRSHKQVFEDEILNLGGKIYKLPGRREGIGKNCKSIQKFLNEHKEYDIIHYNTSSLSDIRILKEATKRNIPVRIVHSHSTKALGNKLHTYIHNLHKKKIDKYATHYFACGDLAAEWFYAGTPVVHKVIIVNNGIDCNLYQYNENIRNKTRRNLSLDNNFVIGHVGRFSEVKNHKFIVNVFSMVVKKYKQLNPKLLLVGNGELFEETKALAKCLKVDDRVLFLGTRHDVPELLQAMDVMIMPSLYEGFPVTAVEGQSAGLPCILSDTITKDVILKANCKMMSLHAGYEAWADAIVKNNEKIVDNTAMVNAGFDINETVNQLMGYYLTDRKKL